jgi:RpiR family carbohydrate utilization transcriptional regulator
MKPVSEKSVLLEIKRMLPSLPEQQRKVARCVLELPHEAVGFSITSLADASGVSNSTVSRFCRRVGLEGYRQFRIALAKEWGAPENLMYVKVCPGDTLASLAQKIFASNVQALRDTQKVLDLDVLEKVVEAILQARRVDIYATGGAGIAARELHFKTMQLGINANAFLDSQMQVMSASSLSPDDVGIGISHSGVQRHVVEALTLAGRGGATTIGLTSYPGSPVAEAADIVLYTASLNATTSFDAPSVRNAQLAVIDVIYEAMVMKGQEVAREKMAQVAKAISDHAIGSNHKT